MGKEFVGVKEGRGRPPKPRVSSRLAMGDGVCTDKLAKLLAAIAGIAEKFSLTQDQKGVLEERLTEAMEHLSAATKLSKISPVASRGNRQKYHISILILDCGDAWQEITGKKAAYWDKGGCHVGGVQASPAISLARAVLEAHTGRPYPQSLKRQIRVARDIAKRGFLVEFRPMTQ